MKNMINIIIDNYKIYTKTYFFYFFEQKMIAAIKEGNK